MSLPGKLLLIGSGETSPSGGAAFEALARTLAEPPNIAILETPAGFEVNSAQVAGRVADYLTTRLQNYHPRVHLIPARKRGGPFSPDNPDLLTPLKEANLVFFGPGSPSYAVRQLRGSLAWEWILARHRLGAAIALASAATVAAGCCALPVYEIFKVGEDPHWKPGLDLLAPFGLKLAIVPHWNNSEGGADVDFSHCFIGAERFDALLPMLEPGVVVLGIDEHSVLSLDLVQGECTVSGRDGIHILRDGQAAHYCAGDTFSIRALGDYLPPESPSEGIDPQVWQAAIEYEQTRLAEKNASPSVPAEVLDRVEARQAARAARDWASADRLRGEIGALGWVVKDTPDGPVVDRLEP